MQKKKTLYIFRAATNPKPVRSLFKTPAQNAPSERRALKAIQQIYRYVNRRYPGLPQSVQDALVRKYLASIRKENGY